MFLKDTLPGSERSIVFVKKKSQYPNYVSFLHIILEIQRILIEIPKSFMQH